MVRKTRKRGKVFYGCTNYPTCNFAIWDRPVATPCPNCGGLVTVAQGKQVGVCTACHAMIEGIGQEGGAPVAVVGFAEPGQNGRASSRAAAKAASQEGATPRRSAGRGTKAAARPATRKAVTRKASAGTKTASSAAKSTATKRAEKQAGATLATTTRAATRKTQ